MNENKMLRLLAQEAIRDGLDGQRPDEFTVMDFLEELRRQGSKVSRYTAIRILNKMVEDGQLRTRLALVRGRWMRVYSTTETASQRGA